MFPDFSLDFSGCHSYKTPKKSINKKLYDLESIHTSSLLGRDCCVNFSVYATAKMGTQPIIELYSAKIDQIASVIALN